MKNFWNRAAIDGLILAVASIILMLLSGLIGNGIATMLLRIVKLGVTIWLLYYLMSKFSKENAAETGSTPRKLAFRYGLVISFFSAILIALYAYINLKLSFGPEMVETFKEAFLSNAGSANLGEEQLEIFDKVAYHLPVIMLVAQLIWCTLFGLIASSIMAGSVKVENTEDI